MTTTTDTTLQADLLTFGLSPKEIKVYEACLTRGEIGVADMVKTTHLSRSTAYFIADELVKKGLLRFIQKGSHRIYAAEDPRKLTALLEQEKADLAKKAHSLDSLLPALQMKYGGKPNKPVVSYYVGQEEIQHIFEDILTMESKELFFVGNSDVLRNAVGTTYLASWNGRKVAAHVRSRGIWQQESVPAEDFLKASKENLREARFAPIGFESPTYFLLYGNKVAFLSSIVEAYCVLIESHDLAITMRSWFDNLWMLSRTP